jgi:hypothetical protein
VKIQKKDKFGRPIWTVILKNGQRFTASGSREEVKKLFNEDGTSDDERYLGSDTHVHQIRAKYK